MSENVVLYVHSRFLGLNGEVCRRGQGSPYYFLRLQGCNLSCPWCDTKGAISMQWDETNAVHVDTLVGDILNVCDGTGIGLLITGGEPFCQINRIVVLLDQIRRREEHGRIPVTIETNGELLYGRAFDPDVLRQLCWTELVIDVKPAHINDDKFPNPLVRPYLKSLMPGNYKFKFLVPTKGGEIDRTYWNRMVDRAMKLAALLDLDRTQLANELPFFVSPIIPEGDSVETVGNRLQDYILSAPVPFGLSMQLHKYLWRDPEGDRNFSKKFQPTLVTRS